ncbi:hypothetical protein D9M69_588480 [compost metagenome]
MACPASIPSLAMRSLAWLHRALHEFATPTVMAPCVVPVLMDQRSSRPLSRLLEAEGERPC